MQDKSRVCVALLVALWGCSGSSPSVDAGPGPVDAGRDATSVVGHGARAVGIERDGDEIGMAGKRLVDGVVDHLVDHVVQAGAVIGVADIHARTLAHGIEALEDLDRIGAIFARQFRCICHRDFP